MGSTRTARRRDHVDQLDHQRQPSPEAARAGSFGGGIAVIRRRADRAQRDVRGQRRGLRRRSLREGRVRSTSIRRRCPTVTISDSIIDSFDFRTRARAHSRAITTSSMTASCGAPIAVPAARAAGEQRRGDRHARHLGEQPRGRRGRQLRRRPTSAADRASAPATSAPTSSRGTCRRVSRQHPPPPPPRRGAARPGTAQERQRAAEERHGEDQAAGQRQVRRARGRAADPARHDRRRDARAG